MNRVLLINPPSEKNYIRSGRWTRKSRGNQQWYPIWLGYCCALLEEHDYECLLLDCPAESLDYQETTEKIKNFNPELIVYYWGYDTAKEDVSYADYLAEKGYETVLAGPWSFCVPDILKETRHLRLMTYGEFEHTILELTRNPQVGSIKGLIWKNHITGEIIRNKSRPLYPKLDDIPFVTKIYQKHLDLYNYRQTSFRYPFIDLLGSRGCPYRCTFCVWIRAFQGGSSYRVRSIKNVIEELWLIHNNIPEIKQVHFQDDTLPDKRMKLISQAILDSGLKISWSGYARAEISRETLELFKKSGGRTLHVGYESANQKSLDAIKKDLTVERMEQFAKDIRDLGIWTCAGFMIYPWETREEVKNTIRWAKKVIKPKRFSFTQLFAYPNTPITQTLKNCQIHLTKDEMTELEKHGFKEYYLKNPSWWLDVFKHPREWFNVCSDANGLLRFLFRSFLA